MLTLLASLWLITLELLRKVQGTSPVVMLLKAAKGIVWKKTGRGGLQLSTNAYADEPGLMVRALFQAPTALSSLPKASAVKFASINNIEDFESMPHTSSLMPESCLKPDSTLPMSIAMYSATTRISDKFLCH